MADIEFGDFVYLCDGANVSRSQSVTGRDVKAVLSCECGAFAQTSQFMICTRSSFAMNSRRAQSRFGIRGCA